MRNNTLTILNLPCKQIRGIIHSHTAPKDNSNISSTIIHVYPFFLCGIIKTLFDQAHIMDAEITISKPQFTPIKLSGNHKPEITTHAINKLSTIISIMHCYEGLNIKRGKLTFLNLSRAPLVSKVSLPSSSVVTAASFDKVTAEQKE